MVPFGGFITSIHLYKWTNEMKQQSRECLVTPDDMNAIYDHELHCVNDEIEHDNIMYL